MGPKSAIVKTGLRAKPLEAACGSMPASTADSMPMEEFQ